MGKKWERWVVFVGFMFSLIIFILRMVGGMNVVLNKLKLYHFLKEYCFAVELWGVVYFLGGSLFFLLFSRIISWVKFFTNLNEKKKMILFLVFVTLVVHFYFFKYFSTKNLPIGNAPPSSGITDEIGNMLVGRWLHTTGIGSYFEVFNTNEITKWRMGTHPPLYFLILSLFGDNYLWMRYLSVIFFIINVTVLMLIGKEICKIEFGMLCGFIFLCMNYYFLYTMRAENDVIGTIFLLLFLYFWLKKGKKIYPLLSGFFLGLGVMSKYTLFLIFPALLLDVILRKRWKEFGIVLFCFLCFTSIWWITLAQHKELLMCQLKLWGSPLVLPHKATSAAGGSLQYLLRLPKDIGGMSFLFFLVGVISVITKSKTIPFFPFFLLYVLMFYITPFFKCPKLNYAMPGAPGFAVIAGWGVKEIATPRVRYFGVFICFLYFIVKLQLDSFYFGGK